MEGLLLKDITAVLVHFRSQSALNKALLSLKKISSRLNAVRVYEEQNLSLSIMDEYDWLEQIDITTIRCNDLGKKLNETLPELTSTYVLFLHETDYLSPTINVDSLHLSNSKSVLGSFYHNRNSVIHRPLLVRSSLLKQETFLSNHQLPFKEALFPAWLSTVDPSLKLFKPDLVKQTGKNSSTPIIEKQTFTQKYQLKKVKTEHPTMTVLISNYNMEKYVETAVASCLLQSEQPDQVLIIDDGSTDNSYKQLKRWDDGNQVNVLSKKNGGKARALNDLLSHVTSDFILELDADDWLDPDAVLVIKSHLSGLSNDVSVVYGNFRKWKQLAGDVLFKRVAKGTAINGKADLLSYRFPLGPRIYRTSLLKDSGGFPVVEFENGRLFEDISVLNRLIKNTRFQYYDFTVYNVREHKESITKMNDSKWHDFLKTLDSN